MWFIDYIISRLNDASSFFYQVYLTLLGQSYPWYTMAPWFYSLCSLFNNMAWAFYYFGQWVNEVSTKITQIVSLSNIYAYFKTYFDYAVYAYNWVYYSWINVTNIIDSWWYYAQQTVLALINEVYTWTTSQINATKTTILAVISNLETWTTAEFNTVRNWVLTLIADIETITPDLLDSVKAFLLSIISNLETWTITEFNVVRDWVLVLLSDIETWTLTQVSTLKSSVLSWFTDLKMWTITEINNIQDMLSAILPWNEILALIISWGAIPAAAIQDLIDSTLQSWFPFYNDLVELWDSIVGFFTDPWQFLYDRLEELFDRYW